MKIYYDDIILIRQLYSVGREPHVLEKKQTLRQLAEKFEVSIETIRRAVQMDPIEVEARRRHKRPPPKLTIEEIAEKHHASLVRLKDQ